MIMNNSVKFRSIFHLFRVKSITRIYQLLFPFPFMRCIRSFPNDIFYAPKNPDKHYLKKTKSKGYYIILKKNFKKSINTEDCGIMFIVRCLTFPYITIDIYNLTFKYSQRVLVIF